MKFIEHNGFADVYPENVLGSDQWFYGQVTPCSEAYEVPDFKGNYEGTRLYLFHKDGQVYEPFAQMKNVFLETPEYSQDTGCFGLIRYDFNEKIIEVYRYLPGEHPELLTSLSMDEVGDLTNVRLVKEPFWLVRHNVHEDSVDVYWPFRRNYQFDEDESLCWVNGNQLITSRWAEAPDYWEEVGFRSVETGELLAKKRGYCREMPDGSIWMMV